MQLYRAIAKSVTGRLSIYIVQFASLAIYARLFTPEQFGIIASIQVFVIFFQMLADVGIGPAIINEENFSSEKRDGIFSVTAVIGCILSIVFFFFSYALNYFYGGYEYQDIAFFVCIAIFFNSLNIVPITAMNKDAKFIHIAIVDILVECISLALVYALFTNGYGLLSLAARPAVQGFTRFTFIWIISINTQIGRPYFGIELHHIKSILSFSLYQFGFNFINYFSRNLDNILVAKYFGMVSVGMYDKAYQLMRYPLMVTTFAMTPAIQPVLTKYRNDKSKVIKEHNLLTSRLLALSLPISVFIYINCNSVILFLFGSQWLAIEPLVKIFTFIIPVQAVLSTTGSFFQVMNKPRLLFISGFVSAILNIAAIVVGVYIGEVEYLALGLVFAYCVNFFQAYFILFKFCFKNSPINFYLYLFKGILVVLPPIGFYILFNSFLVDLDLSSFLDLFINFIVGSFLMLAFFNPMRKVLS
ncbi:oligosaccharide flippase family protein [Shewanella algicola]|uniref:Oligosaccharide flippase family protein n=1 Tax=Shewanella algicola TaxID=640633 RepID=A0A9X2CB58_9GAMM|nr:oligosaccharide flippase family protein [Shewanella algicola]MCL1106149.1 oligosaccharide flippase family protein [Shewanella algicola]